MEDVAADGNYSYLLTLCEIGEADRTSLILEVVTFLVLLE